MLTDRVTTTLYPRLAILSDQSERVDFDKLELFYAGRGS